VPERRNQKRRSGSVAVSLGSQLWTRVARRPVDAFAILGGAVATLVIVVNAVFLQAGAQPAPFVAAPVPPLAPTEIAAKPATQGTLKPTDLAPARAVAAPVLQQAMAVPMPVPAPQRHNDPIADLIGGPSPRIQAVQRVLSEFGYGQIKPTGVLDSATSEAISKFEREHKLPASGRVSDRLVSALGTMAGHPIE
jgi:Putative peptidoglycan binding domain